MTAQRARAARAIELQSAREDAGLTVDELAGRVVDMWDEKLGKGRRARWRQSVEKLSPQISYLERASEGAYDRAEAYSQAPADERSGRPRVHLLLWREALAATHSADSREAVADALRADAISRAAAHRAADSRARDRAREQGRDIATLVWNAAEDPDFLDRVLVDELAAVPPRHLAYLVRAALVDIADELRVTFPDRPSRDLRAVA
ncbi:hypothetical protein [Microbacterium sp. Leaf151]|uniref:hypothetical protein n=1 Tax=Microbacterium sp. Leaf151 TaxID=1736276 RepID=UPI000AF7A90D|nr:hypothetical protein [Microbacterium sp. Leaf151]